ncbi:hypothetical protein TgHK011_008750 [Trichoderma gracile]|nr:hypothetical protein TgHK011_008750 [Trichoderma gracile]
MGLWASGQGEDGGREGPRSSGNNVAPPAKLQKGDAQASRGLPVFCSACSNTHEESQLVTSVSAAETGQLGSFRCEPCCLLKSSQRGLWVSGTHTRRAACHSSDGGRGNRIIAINITMTLTLTLTLASTRSSPNLPLPRSLHALDSRRCSDPICLCLHQDALRKPILQSAITT